MTIFSIVGDIADALANVHRHNPLHHQKAKQAWIEHLRLTREMLGLPETALTLYAHVAGGARANVFRAWAELADTTVMVERDEICHVNPDQTILIDTGWVLVLHCRTAGVQIHGRLAV